MGTPKSHTFSVKWTMWSNLPILAHFFVMWWHILVLCYLGGGPLICILYSPQDTFFHSYSLMSPGEVQSIFHLCISPPCCLLVLLHKPRCVPQFCCDSTLTLHCYCLSDIHHPHLHPEPFHLHFEIQRHQECSEKTYWDRNNKKPTVLRLNKCPWLQDSEP
jgi:hypothetical protein